MVAAMCAVLTASLSVGVTASATQIPGARADTCGGQKVLKVHGKTWVCTFDDEFNGTALDPAKWTPMLTSERGFTTGPEEYRACYTDNPEDISVSDGYLRLGANAHEPFTCQDPLHGDFTTSYSAGEVFSWPQFYQTYGRIQVRAKLPDVQVPGVQETFWLWPVDPVKYGPWPASGEIDFGEFYSVAYDYDIPWIHYYYDHSDPETNTNMQTVYDCVIDITQFNTFTIEWEPGRITLYDNDHVCVVNNYEATGLDSPAPFDQPFFLALTQALGLAPTNAFDPDVTPLPVHTLVDYVRVWQDVTLR
jgi:beta-glucanase (GH16 family)